MFNDLLLMMSVYSYWHVPMRPTRMIQRFWKQRCIADVWTNAYEIQVSASWLGKGSGSTRSCQRFWKQPCIADVWANTYAPQVSGWSFGFGFCFTRIFPRFWALPWIPDIWANTYAFQVSAWSFGCGFWSQRIMHYPDAMSFIARPRRTTVKTTIDGFR